LRDIPSDLWSIIQAGVLAPSADNRHCFEVALVPGGMLLFASEMHLQSPFHKRVLGLISFGAVVENMVSRAGRFGYEVEVTWYPDRGLRSLIAELRLLQTDIDKPALDCAIATRHTNRRIIYRGPELNAVERTTFQNLVSTIDGVRLHFVDRDHKKAELLRLVQIAEAERFSSRALHADLFSAIRFDVGWTASADVGLPPGALAVEPGARAAFGLLRHWPLMNCLKRLGLHHALAFRAAYLPCRVSPNLCILSTTLAIADGAPAVGRALERIWLEVERRGWAFQPFAGPALLALAEYHEVSAETGAALREGWKGLVEGLPLMVFRFGRAPAPTVRTTREPPERYVRDSSQWFAGAGPASARNPV